MYIHGDSGEICLISGEKILRLNLYNQTYLYPKLNSYRNMSNVSFKE